MELSLDLLRYIHWYVNYGYFVHGCHNVVKKSSQSRNAWQQIYAPNIGLCGFRPSRRPEIKQVERF
jgi:hypothetical protein